ncbi:MAG: DUF362 domain-containing protein [Acidobacteriota bacterium]
MTPLSRREFLLTTASAVAWGCRPAPYHAAQFRVPALSPVAILPAPAYDADFADIIGRGLAELELDVRNLRVLLKPNLVEYEPGTVINTNAAVVVGAAVAIRRAGAREVVVAEGPGHRRDLEYLMTSTGLYDHLREERIPFVDLNHDDVRRVTLRSWFTELRELMLPAAVVDADLVVSMPKLKTHHWAGITCSMKNLFGVVPGAVYGWPKNLLHFRGIPQSILDLTATIQPRLAIVDAVVGMEGDGPIMGRPKAVGAIVMGSDPVAVDATAARVMKLRPDRIPYLTVASRFLGNLDDSRIEMRGESVDRFATSFDVLDDFTHLRG